MNLGGYRTIALFVSAALLAGACGSGEGPDTPTASVPVATAEPTVAATDSAPTEAADPFAVPDEIDEAYVERVLEELNESLVEATKIVANERAVPRRVGRILDATHSPRARDGYLRTFRELLRDKNPEVRFRRNPQRVDIVSVEEIVSASPDCMFVLVTQDSSGLVQGNPPPFANYYHVKAKEPAAPTTGNATPWKVALDSEPPPDGKEYADPCE